MWVGPFQGFSPFELQSNFVQELLGEKLASPVTLHFGFDPFYHSFIESPPMFLLLGSEHRIKFVCTNRGDRNVVARMGLNAAPDALDCWEFF